MQFDGDAISRRHMSCPASNSDQFAPETYYTRHLLDQTPFTNNFYTKHPLTPNNLHTKLLQKESFTPDTF